MIRGIIETSLIDWDGQIATVLFFDKCNFMCPFCQNGELICAPEKYPIIAFKKIKKILEKKKGWVDGVVLTGGEPLVDRNEILDITQKIKGLQLKVKIDTNGAYPESLQELIDKKLVDYVAMDVKAPLDDRYYNAAGKKIDLENIKKSIEMLLNDYVEYEFRTTCVPGIIDDKTITEIGTVIQGAKKWALQAFVPDNALNKEYRKNLGPYYFPSLQRFLAIAKHYVPNVRLRGKA